MTLTSFLAVPQDDGQKKDVTAARDERESKLMPYLFPRSSWLM